MPSLTCADCPYAEELAYLRSELGLQVEATKVDDIARAFGLTASQARVVLAMAHGRVVGPWQIEEAAQGKREIPANAWPAVRVLVHRIRASRLGKDSVSLCLGEGYRLSPDAVARVDQILRT